MNLDTLLRSVEPDQPSADFTRKVMNALPQKKTYPPIISKKVGWSIAACMAACVAYMLISNTPPATHPRHSYTLLHTEYFLVIPILVAICLVMCVDYYYTNKNGLENSRPF